jgi:hypothetical protein
VASPQGPWGNVVDVDEVVGGAVVGVVVGEVVGDVVGDVGWHTEMFTVLPLVDLVPPGGFWLSTVPAVAPFAQVESVDVLATRPAALMADCAAVAD